MCVSVCVGGENCKERTVTTQKAEEMSVPVSVNKRRAGELEKRQLESNKLVYLTHKGKKMCRVCTVNKSPPLIIENNFRVIEVLQLNGQYGGKSACFNQNDGPHDTELQ